LGGCRLPDPRLIIRPVLILLLKTDDMVIENAVNIYTDGSSLSHPRAGGIGIRLVWINQDGLEETEDFSPPGFTGATNNQMELHACIAGIKHAMSHPAFNSFDNVAIHTDSQYVSDNYGRAICEWPRRKWCNRYGKPVENVELWKKLTAMLKALRRNGKRFTFYWVEGHSVDKHNKAADKLARQSARKAVNPPLGAVKVRRKLSSGSVEPGCVPMLGQALSIRIITEYTLRTQRLYKYKYEVVAEDSPYLGKVDTACSEQNIMLRATHCYLVKFNDNPKNPRIVEVIEELPKKTPGRPGP
jgi:ribonuclease HI